KDRSSATGYVSASTLLSPPPVGPVWGSKFGQSSRSERRRAKRSNSVSWLRLVSVSRWYSNRERSKTGRSSTTVSEKRSGLRARKNSLGEKRGGSIHISQVGGGSEVGDTLTQEGPERL